MPNGNHDWGYQPPNPPIEPPLRIRKKEINLEAAKIIRIEAERGVRASFAV